MHWSHPSARYSYSGDIPNKLQLAMPMLLSRPPWWVCGGDPDARHLTISASSINRKQSKTKPTASQPNTSSLGALLYVSDLNLSPAFPPCGQAEGCTNPYGHTAASWSPKSSVALTPGTGEPGSVANVVSEKGLKKEDDVPDRNRVTSSETELCNLAQRTGKTHTPPRRK